MITLDDVHQHRVERLVPTLCRDVDGVLGRTAANEHCLRVKRRDVVWIRSIFKAEEYRRIGTSFRDFSRKCHLATKWEVDRVERPIGVGHTREARGATREFKVVAVGNEALKRTGKLGIDGLWCRFNQHTCDIDSHIGRIDIKD